MGLRTEEGNDTAKAEYESIGYQAGEDIVLDSGVIFFNSSSPDGELSFLNNTVSIYKDMKKKVKILLQLHGSGSRTNRRNRSDIEPSLISAAFTIIQFNYIGMTSVKSIHVVRCR